jgi:hypothetical protein
VSDGGADACVPQTCGELGYFCGGLMTDGCGNTIDCGTCPLNTVCGVDGGPPFTCGL